MKTLLVVAIAVCVLVLSGCGRRSSGTEVLVYKALPEELRDCKAYYIMDDNAPNVTIFRCPNSTTTTTYKTGGKVKTTHTNVVIDGVKYAPIEEDEKK